MKKKKTMMESHTLTGGETYIYTQKLVYTQNISGRICGRTVAVFAQKYRTLGRPLPKEEHK